MNFREINIPELTFPWETFSSAEFHFLRPWWFLALIPIAFLIWRMTAHVLNQKSWAGIIDKELLPYVLINKEIRSRHWPKWLLGITGLLSVIALAGPVWEQLPQPVFRNESALVIALDLSRSMDAADLKPSRLARARFKIEDLLKQRKEGQTALIAFASDAYTVTPLTDDVATILSQMKALSTDIMPSQGSRLDRAMIKAGDLLTQAGVRSGDILLVTDSANKNDLLMAEKLEQSGHRVFVFGIGTKDGAPIPDQKGGFFSDTSGNIILPGLKIRSLKRLANLGGGKFQKYTEDDQDVDRLTLLLEKNVAAKEEAKIETTELKTDQWAEQGPWFLLLIIPFAAIAFRKGYLMVLIFLMTGVSIPQDSFSEEEIIEKSFRNNLWKRPDQKANDLFQKGESAQAAKIFEDQNWKGSAQYEAGDYEGALKSWDGFDDADALYNKGNALAKTGQLEEALELYEQALEKQSDFENAQYNFDQVKKALEEQQKQEEDSDENQKGDQKKESEDGGGSEDKEGDRSESENASENDQDSSKENEKNDSDEQEQSDQENDQSEQKEKESGEDEANGEQQDQKEQDGEQEGKQMQQGQESDSATDEEQQAMEAALRAIPDDPGGLLRRKFKYQYQQQDQVGEEDEQW